METRPVVPTALFQTSLSGLFKAHPQLIGVFIRHHVACAACLFSNFCNLQDALEIYSPPPEFLDSILEEIRPKLVLDSVN